jgi:hypothetical protein
VVGVQVQVQPEEVQRCYPALPWCCLSQLGQDQLHTVEPNVGSGLGHKVQVVTVVLEVGPGDDDGCSTIARGGGGCKEKCASNKQPPPLAPPSH